MSHAVRHRAAALGLGQMPVAVQQDAHHHAADGKEEDKQYENDVGNDQKYHLLTVHNA